MYDSSQIPFMLFTESQNILSNRKENVIEDSQIPKMQL